MLMCLILGNLFTVILIISYKFHSEKNTAVNIFVTAKVIRIIAWIMLGLRNIAPDFLSIAFGNSLLMFGTLFESLAVLVLLGIDNINIKKIYAIITIFSVAIFNYIFFFNNFDNLRIATTFTASIILFSITGFYLIKGNKKTLLQQILGLICYMLVIAFAFETYIALIVFPSIKLYTPNAYTSLSFLCIYVAMIVTDTGFVLLAKENLDSELIRLANFDELTNVFNRRAFILHAEKSICLCTRKKEPITFMLIDLDNFKLINDTFGHDVGDSVLIDFSSKVKMQLRTYDIFGRYGGDEFAIMLPSTDFIDSNEVTERLRKIIEKNQVIKNTDLKYTISVGIITLVPDNKTNVDLLYKLSDQALYKAKQQGRNCVVRGY